MAAAKPRLHFLPQPHSVSMQVNWCEALFIYLFFPTMAVELDLWQKRIHTKKLKTQN